LAVVERWTTPTLGRDDPGLIDSLLTGPVAIAIVVLKPDRKDYMMLKAVALAVLLATPAAAQDFIQRNNEDGTTS
jgi:hypothetical protein